MLFGPFSFISPMWLVLLQLSGLFSFLWPMRQVSSSSSFFLLTSRLATGPGSARGAHAAKRTVYLDSAKIHRVTLKARYVLLSSPIRTAAAWIPTTTIGHKVDEYGCSHVTLLSTRISSQSCTSAPFLPIGSLWVPPLIQPVKRALHELNNGYI